MCDMDRLGFLAGIGLRGMRYERHHHGGRGKPATIMLRVVLGGTFLLSASTASQGQTAPGGVAGANNDACIDVIPIGPDEGPFPFDNTFATQDGPTDCPQFGLDDIDNDVWFCWFAPENPCPDGYAVETCGLTNVDTKIAVYDGCGVCPPAAAPIACNDDACGTPQFPLNSRALFVADPNAAYTIRLGTFPGALGGTGQFRVRCLDGPPANDDCANAEPISGEGDFSFENILATPDGPIHAACLTAERNSQIDDDVWFCWNSPCTAPVFVTTCGQTAIDSKIAVYDGCDCPFVHGDMLACNDDSCTEAGFATGVESTLRFDAVADQTYAIRIGSFPGEPTGSGTVSITCGLPECPGTGDCFTGNATAGCDDEDCCQQVCLVDQFCCASQWDQFCAEKAAGICLGAYPTCGPGAGSCLQSNGTPGCDVEDCCNTVCALDPDCCDTGSQWDAQCAAEAAGLCTGDFPLCGPGRGSCSSPLGNGSPGCEDVTCCNEVCFIDPFCCFGEWDEVCALREAEICQSACGESTTDCFVGAGGVAGTGGTGCQDADCCANVCAVDPVCCWVQWDEFCRQEAREMCPGSCPAGQVGFIDPPDGVVDARFPKDATSGAPIGPSVFTVSAPAGGDSRCWESCDTTGTPNPIRRVALAPVAGGGEPRYEITLERSMTPGAVTTLTYTDDGLSAMTGFFTAHPGNVNAGPAADANDIVEMVDCCLKQICTPPWGAFSCDTDHSGAGSPPDIIGLINVLNGVGPFDPWNNSPLPTAGGVCP